MPFAQLVIGPPGSGKSTYCDGMHQFMAAIDRPCSIVNLDPANENPSYGSAAIDIRSILTLDDVMAEEHLGPNGGMLFALEELEHNYTWLEDQLRSLRSDEYVLFDCPGQVELYTYHNSVRTIFQKLQKSGFRLVVVHLLDCFVLTQPSLYISSCLLALRSMLQMELPHVNVLTKLDNLASYPPLPFNLDFYTEVQDLQYLIPHLAREPVLFPGMCRKRSVPGRGRTGREGSDRRADYTVKTDEEVLENINRDSGHKNGDGEGGEVDSDEDDDDFDPDDPKVRNTPRARLVRLTSAIAGLIDDFALLGFHTLAVEDRTSMAALLRAIDLAAGYVFVPSARAVLESQSGHDASSDRSKTTGGVATDTGGGRDPSAPNEAALWSSALRDGAFGMDIRDVQERWVDRKEEFDEMERREWARQAGVHPDGTEVKGHKARVDMWNVAKGGEGSAKPGAGLTKSGEGGEDGARDGEDVKEKEKETEQGRDGERKSGGSASGTGIRSIAVVPTRPQLDDLPDELDDEEALAEAFMAAKAAGEGSETAKRFNGVTVVRKKL